MRETQITISGLTNDKGVFKTSENPELQKFFRMWKNNRFLLTVQVLPQEQSKKLDAYYRQYVLIQVQKGYIIHGEKFVLEDLNEELGQQLSYSGARWFEDLHNNEKLIALNSIKEFAAGNLGVFIEDPRAI